MMAVLRQTKLVNKRDEGPKKGPIAQEKLIGVLRWIKSIDKTIAVLRHVKLVGKIDQGPKTGQIVNKNG